jgi:uncharacterized protein YdiU (UPF0061 family)
LVDVAIQMTVPGLSQLQFDNQFTGKLPGDTESKNFRRQVRSACFSRVLPTRVSSPKLIAYSHEVGSLLDLEGDPFADPEFAEIFSGNQQLPGMDPFAMCYGGHQFGNWAGQLGDGRAINLGEVVNRRGERWALQLKGAGPTPYSRTADGLAVLRSSVREFLCSEAMFHLGVPTTRALSLVLTGEQVVRDMFYDGNPQHEPGAIVCRVAPSFTRFGNFEIFAARRDTDTLTKLIDHTIRTDFPHLGEPSPEVYEEWFSEVCRTTAEMIVHWMRVGFVHGVMNTDNMSILGLTIDYGPYGWLEDYDPNWTPNTTDASGRRYRYGQQPQIAMWNLVQLANAVAPVFDSVHALQKGIDLYSTHFNQTCQTMLAEKLGLSSSHTAEDKALSDELLTLMQEVETDMTIFYRRLATLRFDGGVNLSVQTSDEAFLSALMDAWYKPEQLTSDYRAKMIAWIHRYRDQVHREEISDATRAERMNAVNPKYVLRNYLAQIAIDKATEGDYSVIAELLDILRRPYDEQPEHEQLAEKRPEWARHRAGCSMLSCSS